MVVPVVVGTNPERTHWLKDCLTSIRATTRHRRVHVHRTGGFELTALRAGVTRYRRFLFLQDSCEVLDPRFWDVIDATEPAWLFGGPPMYLGVYDSTHLEAAIRDAPANPSKDDAIRWESELGSRLHHLTLWPDVHDGTAHHEHHHGRDNLVLQNRYLRKWKGNWGQ